MSLAVRPAESKAMTDRSRLVEEDPIQYNIKQLATKTAIVFLRAIRVLKKGAERAFQYIAKYLTPVGSFFLRTFVVPIYRVIIMARLRFRRTVMPSRGFALFFVSNKYLFHVVLGAAGAATLLLNLRTGSAQAQDVGQNSLLYALATNSEIEIVQEVAREEEPTHAMYAEPGTLVAVPHIDFDYGEEEQVASISIPGTISAVGQVDTTEGPSAPRTKTEVYVVEQGDTLASIAHQFGVNVGTILYSNSLSERQYIRPGDSLKIPPVSGVLVAIKKGDTISKLAKKYEGSEAEIRDFNMIQDETSLAIGTEIMIPNGKIPQPEQTFLAVSGRSQEPTASANIKSTKKPANADTGSLAKTKLLWPTTGHAITQYYGWRHTGLDIDGNLTSPLYAAYDGVVTTAGWNSGGYGLQILIKHPNGVVTRYAHSSKLFVKIGDQVTRGQVIAMMGSTGRSTGSHLHFEVYMNGKRVNPLGYIR